MTLYGGRLGVDCNNATSTTPAPSYTASDIRNCHDAVEFEGIMDALFMFSYAAGLLVAGSLGDRYNNRWVLFYSMCGSSLAYSLLGWSKLWHYERIWLYVAAWIANGLLQSATWPTIVAIMGHWFPAGTRGTVLGVWSANASLGNIVGDSISGWVQAYGWVWVFFVPGAMLFLGGIIMLLCVRPQPEDVGLKLQEEPETPVVPTASPALVLHNIPPEPGQPRLQPNTSTDDMVASLLVQEPRSSDSDSDSASSNDASALLPSAKKQKSTISCWRAVCLPNVLIYSLAYACIKASNYALFFW